MFPMDILRYRIMMQQGLDTKLFENFSQTLKYTYANEGYRGLFRSYPFTIGSFLFTTFTFGVFESIMKGVKAKND